MRFQFAIVIGASLIFPIVAQAKGPGGGGGGSSNAGSTKSSSTIKTGPVKAMPVSSSSAHKAKDAEKPAPAPKKDSGDFLLNIDGVKGESK